MFVVRPCDQEILNSPPTQFDLDRGWRKLGETGKKNGRTICAFQCLKCSSCYNNHKNAGQHLAHCPALKRPKEATIEHYFSAHSIADDNTKICQDLIELIAAHNIPYTQLQSFYWAKMFSHFVNGFTLPSIEVFNKMILEYSNTVEKKELPGSQRIDSWNMF